jgi:hypothetical protein
MKIFLTVLITIAGLFIVLGVFIWSGVYNMAAVKPHRVPVVWLIEQARNRSIAVHSKDIPASLLMDNPKVIAEGLECYHSMCRWCHGAPGFNRSEFALGLYPSPPPLGSGDVQGRRESELFWIVKNGLKMTGMPAFGPTHTDEQLWGTVALLRRLPKLPAKEYKNLVQPDGPEKHVH